MVKITVKVMVTETVIVKVTVKVTGTITVKVTVTILVAPRESTVDLFITTLEAITVP